MRAYKVILVLVVLALGATGAEAALSRTYPNSAVTTIRLSAYQDGFETIWKSTWSIEVSTWIPMISIWTYLIPDTTIYGYISEYSSGTWTVKESSWSLSDYNNLLIETVKLRITNEILDEDIEQYLVWPDTTTMPVDGWRGWCLVEVNGTWIPGLCP